MGRPNADPPPSYVPTTGSDPQPQEHYQYDQVTEAPDTLDDVNPLPYEAYYNAENQHENYQNQSSDAPENDPQNQQQFQQPPPPSQQSTPYYHPQNPRPQANPAYQTQPGPRPVPYPPQSPQTSATQAVPHPPQNPPMVPPRTPPTSYPPQANPQAFPPPQAGPQFFPPPRHVTFQPPNMVQFPPPPSQAGSAMPPSYLKPYPQVNGPAQGIAVPNQYLTPQVGTEGWKTGLFDCMDDPGNALVTACFPCVTFGQTAEIIDNGQTSCGTSGMLYGLIAAFIGLPCLISCTYRTKLRSRYGIVESPGPDWITHCFCEWCALCQEYRELQHRGLDPSIGWLGNMAKIQNMQQQQQVAMAPPTNQKMMA